MRVRRGTTAILEPSCAKISAMRRSRALIATVLALLLAACTSIRHVGNRPFEGEGGAVRVRVFADDAARRAGRPLGQRIVGELELAEGRQWRPVFRSLEPTWTVAGLAPGRYRVAFSARLDANGEVEGLERSVARAVQVRAGEVAEVEVVLDHVSPAMVAAGAAAIVVAAVLLHEWLDDLDLPRPPVPPAWVLDTVFYVTLDLASEPRSWVSRATGPQVTSHFPAAEARVDGTRPRVIFALSEPLAGAAVGADVVEVIGPDGEPLPGRASYDAEHWWIVWEPDGDLPAGARLEARLDPDRLLEDTDAHVAGPVGFAFSIAP